MIRSAGLAAAVLAAVACVPTPPPPQLTRPATPVAASFDRTWAAVISNFASRGIGIATIEKASGIIATEEMAVRPGQEFFFDCGKDRFGGRIAARVGRFNVFVTGDSVASQVRVNARFVAYVRANQMAAFGRANEIAAVACSSTGRFEQVFESFIKIDAESK